MKNRAHWIVTGALALVLALAGCQQNSSATAYNCRRGGGWAKADCKAKACKYAADKCSKAKCPKSGKGGKCVKASCGRCPKAAQERRPKSARGCKPGSCPKAARASDGKTCPRAAQPPATEADGDNGDDDADAEVSRAAGGGPVGQPASAAPMDFFE